MKKLISIKYYTILLGFSLLTSCEFNQNNDNIPLDSSKNFIYSEVFSSNHGQTKDLIKGDVPIYIDSEETLINWNTYQSNDKQLAFSLPSTWEIEKRDNCDLYCNLDESEVAYFSFIANSKESNNLSLNDYLGELYNTVSRDASELLVDYDAKKVALENRLMYIFSFETKKKNLFYLTYSCFTEDELNIFDFTLKRKKESMTSMDKILFDIVLENFKVNENRLFKNSKKGFKTEKIEFGVN